jgi:tetrahydromethanopterin S-methyltransferase subunit G
MREGFRQVTGRLDFVEAKLGEHSSVLEEHSHRLDRIERKLDNTIERVMTTAFGWSDWKSSSARDAFPSRPF